MCQKGGAPAMDARVVQAEGRAADGQVTSTRDDYGLYSYSGPLPEVAARLYGLPADLVRRRLYLLLLETPGQAGIHIFERDQGDSRTGTVTTWQGQSLDGLPGLLLQLLMASEDSAPRKKVLSAVRSGRDLKPLDGVLCPATPRAAFGHALRIHDQQSTLQATVVAL
jgi:hypothetical protein